MTLPVLPPSSAACEEALQELERLAAPALTPRSAPVLRQQQPGQGDVLELAQVAEVVVDGQAAARAPSRRASPSLPLRDPHPRPHRRDRPHVGGEVTGVHPLRLVEQVDRTVEVPFGLPDPGHRDPPAVRVLRQAEVLAELLAAQQELGRGRQVVALAVQRGHPDVHVGRSPQDRPALLRGEPQRLLVRAHGVAEAALDDVDVRQRDRQTEDVGDVAGPLHVLPRLGVPRLRRREVPVAPRRQPDERRRRRSPEVVVGDRRGPAPAGRARCSRPRSPSISACPARCTATDAGSVRNRSSSTTTMSGGRS